MAYGESGYKRPIWIPIVAVLLLIGIFFRPTGCGDRARLSTPTGVEAELLADKQFGRLFSTIKATYPDEMRGIVDHIAGRVRDGTPLAQLQAENQRYITAAMERHLPELLLAPPAELAAMNRAEAALVTDVRKHSPKACAHYGDGGFRPGDVLPPSSETLAVDLAIARWKASAAGRDRPEKRKIAAELSPADYNSLIAAMRRSGISETDLAAFQQGRMGSMSDAGRCDITYHLTQAINAMPADQADRFTRWLLSQDQTAPQQR